jgi:hypothetical protein
MSEQFGWGKKKVMKREPVAHGKNKLLDASSPRNQDERYVKYS